MKRALLIGGALLAMAQTQRPTADLILKNMERAFGPVTDLVVTMEGVVDLEGIRVPRTTAELYYKRPGKLHVDSRGFAMIPRDGMSPDPAMLRERYDATLLGQDTLEGRTVWKLQLAAKDAKVRLRQIYAWVDPRSWTLARMETTPYEGRTIALEFEYGLQEGRYWLPLRMVARFGTTGPQTDPLFKVPDGAPNPAPQMEEMQRRLRSGSLTFTYRNYRINTGIPDSLFDSSPTRP